MAERHGPGRGAVVSRSVVTIGTFDGVHRGHAALLGLVTSKAESLGTVAAAVTFDPHPAEVLRPGHAPLLLTPGPERIEALATTGIQRLLVVPFDEQLASYDPARFVSEILVARLGVRHLVIGHDHAIGRDRSGDAETLVEIGRGVGFGVDVVDPVQLGGTTVSSSVIRRHLAAGQVEVAARALGRPYEVRGTVVRGDGRGRSLGFPTANVAALSTRKLVPGPGVYAGRASVAGQELAGAIHVGPRPTFQDTTSTLEFFAFDFDGDLYGEAIRVRFCARVRDIERFDSGDALIRAMHDDTRRARSMLEGAGPCAQAPN